VCSKIKFIIVQTIGLPYTRIAVVNARTIVVNARIAFTTLGIDMGIISNMVNARTIVGNTWIAILNSWTFNDKDLEYYRVCYNFRQIKDGSR